ncbi:MAG TPA: hypothetical protein VEK08_20090 [Planctomycetota bacterium]|nr:hypothetical protein [Planctomycetota bacterium]
MDADPEALRDAIRLTKEAVREVPGAYACFIGGLAVQEHGYARWTDDVDVVVDAEHYADVLNKLREKGFQIQPNGVLKHRDTSAQLDLLKEGVRLKDSRFPLPHPSELGANRSFATVQSIIRLKLDSGGRMKDLADIVELLKLRINDIDKIRIEIPSTMQNDFDELASKARREIAP